MDSSTVVISPRFCFQGEIHLTIVKKIMPISGGNFTVTNDKGDIIFNVKQSHCHPEEEKALSLKILNALERWQVYKGDSSDPVDVFSAAQFRTDEVEVILGNKKENNSWDFTVVGSWLERSGIIYNHHLTAIAQVQRKHRFRCVMKGKDTLSVTVSPNVDHSFVVALVVTGDA